MPHSLHKLAMCVHLADRSGLNSYLHGLHGKAGLMILVNQFGAESIICTNGDRWTQELHGKYELCEQPAFWTCQAKYHNSDPSPQAHAVWFVLLPDVQKALPSECKQLHMYSKEANYGVGRVH